MIPKKRRLELAVAIGDLIAALGIIASAIAGVTVMYKAGIRGDLSCGVDPWLLGDWLKIGYLWACWTWGGLRLASKSFKVMERSM